MERIAGFEPVRTAWEAVMLPLHHIRKTPVFHVDQAFLTNSDFKFIALPSILQAIL